MNRDVSIVGWGRTDVGELPKEDYYSLNEAAAADAMARAGVGPSDIDGIVASTTKTDVGPDNSRVAATVLAEHLGVMPGLKYASMPGIGGASQVQHLAQAQHAIESGLCETVLVVAADNMVSGIGSDAAVEDMAGVGHAEVEAPYGPLIPSMYALAARRYLHEHGASKEDLARVAVLCYQHASMQPSGQAHLTQPRTVDEILDSPMIATPLTRDQCSLVSDGGGALVLASREDAPSYAGPSVDLLGFGANHSHEHVHQMADLTTTGAEEAAAAAFSEAGVDREDVDVLELYDCFTITVLEVLEDMGFCDRGAAGELVESGALELDGRWPMNTNGGLLANGHPGVAGGLLLIVEAVRQLTGAAGRTQVEGASTALVHGNGGILGPQTVSILARGNT